MIMRAHNNKGQKSRPQPADGGEFHLNPGRDPVSRQLQTGDMVAICGDSITEQRLYRLHRGLLLMCQPVAGA